MFHALAWLLGLASRYFGRLVDHDDHKDATILPPRQGMPAMRWQARKLTGREVDCE
jgi:hypothetical protein